MKKSFLLLFLLIILSSPLLCQVSFSNLFNKDWNLKIEEFKKINKDKKMSEQDLSATGAKGVTMFMYSDKLDQTPVMVQYIFTKDGLAMKGLAGGADAKTAEKLLKICKEQTVKKYGKTFEERETNGMKITSWKKNKNYTVTILQRANSIVMQIGDKNKTKGLK